MQQNILTCLNRVGGIAECNSCKGLCIKYGKTSAGKQRYRCKVAAAWFLTSGEEANIEYSSLQQRHSENINYKATGFKVGGFLYI